METSQNDSKATTTATSLEYETSLGFKIVRMMQFVLGISGNILIIIVITKYKKLHLPGNIILISIAASDVITSINAPIVIGEEAAMKEGNSSWLTPFCYIRSFLCKYVAHFLF